MVGHFSMPIDTNVTGIVAQAVGKLIGCHVGLLYYCSLLSTFEDNTHHILFLCDCQECFSIILYVERLCASLEA